MSNDAGYSIYDDVFRPSEMHRVVEAIDGAAIARTRAGARNILQVPAVRSLALDARLLDIARQSVGVKAFPYRATLFDKSLSTNWLVSWHQDTALPVRARTELPGWGPWTRKAGVLHAIAPASALQRIIALRVHLDGSTDANGPLRVLPGTHKHGILDRETIGALASTVEPVACTTTTGGVVAIHPLTLHASSKARAAGPRRVVHIEYAADVHFDRDIELAVG